MIRKQVQALEGDREVALMHLATAQAAIDTVAIEMPERLHYPTPRMVSQIRAPTYRVNAAGVEVQQDGSPLPLPSLWLSAGYDVGAGLDADELAQRPFVRVWIATLERLHC